MKKQQITQEYHQGIEYFEEVIDQDKYTIKPCPMCGSKSFLIRRVKRFTATHSKTGYDIACSNDNCHLYKGAGKWYIWPEKAIELWNQRK